MEGQPASKVNLWLVPKLTSITGYNPLNKVTSARLSGQLLLAKTLTLQAGGTVLL